MKRCVLFTSVLVLFGCPPAEVFQIDSPSSDKTLVPGGIGDTRPYFGAFKTFDGGQTVGDFMLASCGCGDWRVLVRGTDGSQTQFVAGFYMAGAYSPTGEIDVFGEDGDQAIYGVLNQDSGVLAGRVRALGFEAVIDADREDAHELSVTACILCHIGDDPIWPLPAEHTGNSRINQAGPTVCLECHSANGQ